MPDAATPPRRSAAFFDVDGTLAATNIVHYYVYFRRHMMSPLWRPIWSAAYLARCIYYLILDKIDRSRLNVVFYRDYAGLPAEPIRARARDCYRDVIVPRRFVEAAACLDEQRAAGRLIVLVTGSIDFIIEPLAKELGIEHVLSPSLVESGGCFTGDLDGLPVGDGEKARRMNGRRAA